MAYCTLEDILTQLDEDTLIELTDDAGAGTVNGAVVERAIADADAAIDAYCQGRYTLPLSPVPPMIRRISVDMAIYHLYSRRGDAAPETRRDRHRDAVRFLQRVAEGQIRLGAESPAARDSAASVEIDSNTRVFSRERMEGY